MTRTATASQVPVATGLLVDDDALYLQTLQRSLARNHYASQAAQSFDAALALARQPGVHFDFALIDLKLGAHSGLDLVGPLRQLLPAARIVLITGFASVATAVEAIKRGADNYLLKPVTAAMIINAITADATPAPASPQPTMTPLSRLEWEHINQALVESDGNISAAARLLGMHRRSLQRKLSKRPGPERPPKDD